MKTTKPILVFLTFCSSIIGANAQTINCNDFSVLGFAPDEFNNGNSIVHVYLDAAANTFISYPYVSVVMDCNGDTIAEGGINFFGQSGQTVLTHTVTGVLTSACLPLTIEFVYVNTNFETDTCMLSINSLATPMACADLTALGIGEDESNTLINIAMQGTETTYISYPQISFVTDCNGDTIATGFDNFIGQIGLSTQGYPITSLGNTVCYPITVEFIYGNTNFETDTCFITLNSKTVNVESTQISSNLSIFPNPAVNQVNLQTDLINTGTNYFIYNYSGKLIFTGIIVSESTTVDLSAFSKGMYFIKIGNNLHQTVKVVKE